MFYNSLQYSGTKTVGLRNCIICTNHALAQSIPPGPPRRHRATLPSSPARTPTTGLFPEGDRLEAHDEVRPTAMRLPPRSFPASRPLLRMDLQSPGQDGQREAQLASRPALSGRHQTAPQTQGHAGQDGAPLANRFSSPGEASREYRLTSGCAAWSHYRLFSALRLPPVAYPACSPSLAPPRPPSGSRSDEKSGLAEPRCRPSPPRALTVEERAILLGHLHAERFQDRSPAEVYGTLLDEGVYCCSIRTLYRLLAAEGESRERRDQLIHPPYQKPQLLATAPNQLWSWDITKLLGPAKWTYFYLYVILDVFSRYVVGWMVAHREGKELARQFIAETCAKHQIVPGQLTLHADRGSPMPSKPVAFLLADLGVTKTHSRPHVSDDNPFSESHFKTLKYRPEFPDRFGSLPHARSFCQEFFSWYNTEHHHSGLGLLTPEVVHSHRAEQVRDLRQHTLDIAYAAHPERFVRKPPQPPALPTAVWINPPPKPESGPPDSEETVQ